MIDVVDIKNHERFDGVFWVIYEDGTRKLATVNLVPNIKVYGEQLIKFKGKEYRVWNPFRSKLAGAILKGLEQLPIKRGSKILYLGAASGTTPSHVSDIIGEEGLLFGVEFSPRVMREFVEKCVLYRKNAIPILADARFPTRYSYIVEQVDVIYADIAQPFQSKIVVDNANVFLKDNGWIIQAIKAMSIDVTKEPSETYKKEIEELKNGGFEIIEVHHLEPYDIAHAFVVGKKT